MTKKSIIIASILFAGMDIQAANLKGVIFANDRALGVSHGGTKQDIDALQDGVGVSIGGITGRPVDFQEYNEQVYKRGEEAKKLDMSLKDYLANEGISYREKLFDNYVLSAVDQFKSILINKCGIDESTFNSNFNESTGEWSGDINCASKSLSTEDLNKFAALKYVSGALSLYDNSFENVDGLSNLTSVGDYFYLYNNPYLTNVDGLSNLTSVGSYFYLYNNPSLTNVDGLSNLTSVGSYFLLEDNPALKDISGISNISSVHPVFLDNENSNVQDYQNTFNVKIDGSSALCNSTSIYYYNGSWTPLPDDKHYTVCQ